MLLSFLFVSLFLWNARLFLLDGSCPLLMLSYDCAPIYTNSSPIETNQTNLNAKKSNSQALLMNVLYNEAHKIDRSSRTYLLDLTSNLMADRLQGVQSSSIASMQILWSSTIYRQLYPSCIIFPTPWCAVYIYPQYEVINS